MKQLFLTLLVLSLLASCKDKNYGKKIDDKGAITIAKLNEKMKGKTELQNVKITGRISDVCQEMGCWMNLEKGDGTVLFIKMKDHEFFVPKDAAGKTAICSGIAKLDTISVEDQRHYAEDAKKPKEEIEKITTPKYEISFDATGVIIR